MKHLLTILSGLLVALLFARCADDDNLSGGIDGLPERGIVIRLSTGELDTRTQLTSTGDYHHVEEVWAVLYKWNGNESADPTTDPNNHGNYYFESATRLNLEDGSPWNPYDASTQSRPNRDDYQTDEAYNTALDAYLESMQTNYGGEYGNGKVQGREFVLPETNDMTNGTYRVLCIGFDEASKTVYGLRSTGDKLSDIFTDDKTLADAYATISTTDKTRFQGELFAGWQEFEFEPDNINIVEVELKRRVAGVLCYVNDIPTTITNAGETYNINTIRLCLNTKANDAIHLCRLDDRTKDFGMTKGDAFDGDEDKTILAEYKIPDKIIAAHQGEVQGQGKEIFEGDLGQTFEDVQIKKGSVLLGAYLIPIKHVEGKATLSVELLAADGTVAKTFNAVRGDDPDGELTDDATQNTTSYDILPNYIYHIGDKDDDIDEPMSLLGQKITVVPKDWKGETIPVEFPSVPVFCTMELWGNDGIYTTQRYIFDCIGIDDVTPVGIFTGDYSIHEELKAPRLWLRINPSVLKSKWKLIIYDLDNPSRNSMLYLNLDGQYDNIYEASGNDKNEMKQFPVVMTDNLTGNFRTAVVQLDTYDANGTNPIRSDTIHVHQYEAILNGNLGFSRFDLGTERDYRTGKVTKEYQYTWGYQDSYGIRTFFPYTSGLTNYKRAKRDADNYPNLYERAFYGGAAFYYSAVQRFTINNGKKEYNVEDDIYDVWFLPAYDEMESFMKLASSEDGNYGIKAGEAYWTGSAGDGVTSWDIFLDGTFTGGGYYGAQRTVPKYIRRACQIKTD